MSKAFKTALTIVVGVAAFCGAYVLFVYLFSRHLWNANECLYIDNVELHAAVDVPDIDGSDCDYDPATGVKKVRFTINRRVDMRHYIDYNKLAPLRKDITFAYNDLIAFQPGQLGIGQGHAFYRNGGAKDGEHWKVLVDTATKDLWVTIYYKKG